MDFPRWCEFEVKSKDSVRTQFENLCRLLFCMEIQIEPEKLESVKNQAGNETKIVLYQNELVGFQSKYFDEKYNFQEFKKSIFRAKKYNKEQTVIYLYMNKDIPSENSERILKDYVHSLGMRCELRFNNQILGQVIKPEYRDIYNTFFNLRSDEERVFKSCFERTDSYFHDIQTAIPYKDSRIVIDRQNEMETLISNIAKDGIVFVSGGGGCGKTSLVKCYLEKFQKNDVPVVVYRGERFNRHSIGEMLGYDESIFFDVYFHVKRKFFIIDSAEQLLLNQYAEEISLLIRRLRKEEWKIIVTCRAEHANFVVSFFQSRCNESIGIVEVNRLSDIDLDSLSHQYDFVIPADYHLRDYIRNPMELGAYLNSKEDGNNVSFSDYKKREWNKTICGVEDDSGLEHKERESIVLEMAKTLYVDGSFLPGVSVLGHEKALAQLEKKHVLVYDQDCGGYRFGHDLYGEWALTELLDRAYQKTRSLQDLYREYGKNVTGHRCLRQWISDKLTKDNKITQTICDILKGRECSSLRDIILMAILRSEYVDIFIRENKQMLLDEDCYILKELLFWLPIACVYICKDELYTDATASTVPIGQGWQTVIEFIYMLGDRYWVLYYNEMLPILLQWSKANERGTTTKLCGEIAINLLDRVKGTNQQMIYRKIIPVIYNTVYETANETTAFIQSILSEEYINNYSLEYSVLEYAITECGIGNYRVSKYQPQLMMDIWEYCWHNGHFEDEGLSHGYYASYGLDRSFRITSDCSWHQTSMVALLLPGGRFADSYLKDFFNKAVNQYIKNHGKNNHLKKITFSLGGTIVEQWGDEELWCAYRNRIMSGVPHIMVSLLRALEWYLDRAVRSNLVDCDWMMKLICGSNNIMITAVVTAVALKNLDRCKEFVDELAQSEDLKALDKFRWSTEYDDYEVNMPASADIRTSFSEKEIKLKKNAHLCQAVALTNYTSETQQPPMSPYDRIMNAPTMAPVKWAVKVFDSQCKEKAEALRFVEEAKHLFEEYDAKDLMYRLNLSNADAVAAAYIIVCERKDEIVDWCKDIILEVLRESYRYYNPASLYDGEDYCIRAIPRLLILYPELCQDIFDALLQLCLNIRDRANKRPLDDCVVDMIRTGQLWRNYRQKMTDFIKKYVCLCRKRTRGLRPVEVSLALRMMPDNDLGLRYEWLRMKLIRKLLGYELDVLKQGKLTTKQLSEPIGAILLRKNHSYCGRYVRYLILRSLGRKRINEIVLHGIFSELSIKDVESFFISWKLFAKKVFGFKKKTDIGVFRLRNILTLRENGDVVTKMAGNDEFNKLCLQYMSMLLERFVVDIDIMNGVMIMAGLANEKNMPAWIGLLHQAVKKADNNCVRYAGLSWMEGIIRKMQNSISSEISSNAVLRNKVIDILDTMIECGSSKAFVMKEYL